MANSEKPDRRSLVWLVLILLLGLCLRLFFVMSLVRDPAFEWQDPDGYLASARMLSEDGWRWSFRAVRYHYAGRDYFLPPLYPVFLSVFSVFADMALAAQLGQMIIGVGAVALLFELARLLHSVRAGLVAAGVYVLWLPNIIVSWFYQEALYVPLVILAFVLFLRASRPGGKLLHFILAGAAFGLAALTRSMPLYFLLPLAAAHITLSPSRGTATRQALAMVLGFAVFVVPYSAALSLHVGEPTIIENHGGILLLTHDPLADSGASTIETVRSLLRALGKAPAEFAGDLLGSVRSLFQLTGGRLLQIYIVAPDETAAVVWKTLAHCLADLALVVCVLLAPLGFVLARRRDACVACALWILVNVTLVALGGFGGARLRAPFEPHLVVLASVILAGGWVRVRRAWMILAGLVSVSMAAMVLPQVPRTLGCWPDYGIRWQPGLNGWRTLVRGEAGFNVLARRGLVQVELRARRYPESSGPTVVEVLIGRRAVAREVLQKGESRHLEYHWQDRTIAYVELRARSWASGEPRRLLVVARPR